ncbi:MAG: zinc-ribbon domain-containing protein [Ruminococcaceae bacterium]|nr:zinc-ribbon domain-containing protein [Oscillospiraceae bacterium]
MYCSKCGNEITQVSRFCAICGSENPNYAEVIPAATPMVGIPKKNGKTKKMILIVASIAAVLLIAYLLFGGKRIDLKYDWGTDMSEILADGGKKWSDRNAYIEDGGDVDEIEEFPNVLDVWYYFGEDGLYSISYHFESGDSLEYSEIIEIVAKYYGDHYYEHKEYGLESGYPVWWWKDGTVVVLKGMQMTYYDEDYYMEEYKGDYRLIKDYFGK